MPTYDISSLDTNLWDTINPRYDSLTNSNSVAPPEMPSWGYVCTPPPPPNDNIVDEKILPFIINRVSTYQNSHILVSFKVAPRGFSPQRTSCGTTIKSSAMVEWCSADTNSTLYGRGRSRSDDTLEIRIPKEDWFLFCDTIRWWNRIIALQEETILYNICPSCNKIQSFVHNNNIPLNVGECIEECGNCKSIEEIVFDYNITHVRLREDFLPYVYIDFRILSLRSVVKNLPSNKYIIQGCCTRCGTRQPIFYRRDDFVLTQGCSTCNDFFAVCTDCEVTTLISRMALYKGNYICDEHFQNTCCDCCLEIKECFNQVKQVSGEYHGDRVSVWLCIDCADTPIENYLECEYSYSYKDDNIIGLSYINKGRGKDSVILSNLSARRKTKSVVPFMGCEIELCTGKNSAISRELNPDKHHWSMQPNRAIYLINKALEKPFNRKISIAKHDGTIPCGSEFITIPMDLNAWHKLYWSNALTYLFKHNDVSNTDRRVIGGHIHLNKSSCTKQQIYFIVHFLHENAAFMTDIAGRVFSKSSEWCSAKLAHSPINMVRVANYVTPERYVALNITEHTIEHRYFAVPMSNEDAIRNVEFVHALWACTRLGKIKDIKSFFSFIFKNYRDYPFLLEWLKSKELSTYKTNSYTITYSSDRCEEEEEEPQPSCDICSGIYDVEYLVNTDQYLCSSCYDWCERCGALHCTNARINDDPCCNTCYENYTYTCPCCDERQWSSESNTVLDSIGIPHIVCDYCYENNDAISICDSCSCAYYSIGVCPCTI